VWSEWEEFFVQAPAANANANHANGMASGEDEMNRQNVYFEVDDFGV
jgi:hypothetical protein